MTHDTVRKEEFGDGAHGPVLHYRSLTSFPSPYPFPFPFSSAKRLHQAHIPHKYPTNILEVMESEMVHRTQDTLYCGIKDVFRMANNRRHWCKELVPHHARREGHRSQGLDWVGLGWYIIPKPTADSASNGGSMSNPPNCGNQSNTQAVPTEYYHGVLVNRSFHLAASTTLIAGRPCHYHPCSGLNGQQSMPRQSHKIFKA